MFLFSVLLVISINSLNFWLGHTLYLSFLFIVPIYLTAWFTGFRNGILISALSAFYPLITASIPNPTPPTAWITSVNAMTMFTFFVIFSYFVSALRMETMKVYRHGYTDGLTGLLNTRAFYKEAERERVRAQRYGYPLTLCVMDLDGFKRVNDTYGHLKGDELLRETAQILHGGVRQTDLVARLGGDEFAILFPELDMSTAERLIQKIHFSFNGSFVHNGFEVTPSIGVVYFYDHSLSIDKMISKADACMYNAKRSGKNQIISECFGNPVLDRTKERVPNPIPVQEISPLDAAPHPWPRNGKERVLLVEDNPGDAHLIHEILRNHGKEEFILSEEQRLEKTLKLLSEQKVDIVLLDLGLPDSFGLRTLVQVRTRVRTTPIVVLSAIDDPQMALDAIRMGAQDYLIKDHVLKNDSLIRVLRYTLERNRQAAPNHIEN
jgi:diguanylate cyclase (GGDEF)-like protein